LRQLSHYYVNEDGCYRAEYDKDDEPIHKVRTALILSSIVVIGINLGGGGVEKAEAEEAEAEVGQVIEELDS
jgi:hypothetical protein